MTKTEKDGDLKMLIILALIGTVFFVCFTLLVKYYGFTKINSAFLSLTGINKALYKISDVLGYISLGIALYFAFFGLIQLIKTKSLLKVDHRILMLGIAYAIIFLLYFLFSKDPICMRPDGLETSYPSSHTLLFIFVNVTAIYEFSWIVKNEQLYKILSVLIIAMTIVGVVCRLLSGCHWLTDIVGAVILATTLILYYFAVIWKIK